MNVQKQLMSAAIRAEAKRHEGVKLHLNKVFRLVEHVSDQPLKNNIKASLSIVRGKRQGRGWAGLLCPTEGPGARVTTGGSAFQGKSTRWLDC